MQSAGISYRWFLSSHGLLEKTLDAAAMIFKINARAGLEAALVVESVEVGVEEVAALLRAGGHHLLLLHKTRALLVLYGDGLKTRGLKT